ncbi:MAG TPA: putative toxin-antitoxin system toxin component, PIN family [Blastocatellia bacterium]|nr:putative toxin-antitoxin system toxin component, PIN family [Blastocatellia bacterium]
MKTDIGAVFDCNVSLQAAARQSSPSAACLRLAEGGFVHLYISEEILTEVADVLSRPKVRARFPELTDKIVEEFSGQLTSVAETISDVPRRFVYQRDVDDEPYINLAVEAGAHYLVSRDKDLLDLMTGHTSECKEFRRRFRP